MANILQVIVAGNFSQLSKALRGASKDVTGFHKGLLAASIGAGAALAALGVAAKVGFDEFVDAQKVTAQTNAVLKSTGGIANVTAKEVDTLSTSLMKKSGVDDEVIKSGANVLLTFTRVRNEAGKGNDIFNQGTKAALNLSVALGKDLNSSSILVGKALNDPIKGMTALTRAGVQFTDGQRDTIKSLVDSGNVLGAQKVILKELETQFGGSAAAAGQTFAGKMNIARESAKNLAGNLVGALMPVFQTLVGVLSAATGWMTRHQTATKVLVVAIASLSAAVLVTNAVMKVSAASTAIAAAAKAIFTTQTAAATVGTEAQTVAQTGLNTAMRLNPIGIVITALAALGTGLVIAYQKSETFRNIVKTAFDVVKTAANAVKDAVQFVINVIQSLANNSAIRTIAAIVGGPFVIVAAHVDSAVGAIRAVISAGQAVVGWGGWRTLGGIIAAPFNAAIGAINRVISAINAVINAARAAKNAVASAFGGGTDPSRTVIVNPALRDTTPPEGAFGATGAVVTRKTLSWIGEAGPEAVVPLNRTPGSSPLPALGGGGGATINVTVNGWVGNDQDIADRIRTLLIRDGRRMPGVLGGLA